MSLCHILQPCVNISSSNEHFLWQGKSSIIVHNIAFLAGVKYVSISLYVCLIMYGRMGGGECYILFCAMYHIYIFNNSGYTQPI